jgi:hypothetical protein
MANLKLKAPSGGSVSIISADSASDYTLTVPAASYSLFSPELDVWNYNGNQTLSSGTTILSGWERATRNTFTKPGTGLTQSSNIFTFPSTGTYLITFNLRTHASGTRDYIGAQIVGTLDNSSYTTISAQYSSLYSAGGSTYCSVVSTCYFTVSSTSLCKVKFNADISGSTTIDGVASDYSQTYVMFQKVSA